MLGVIIGIIVLLSLISLFIAYTYLAAATPPAGPSAAELVAAEQSAMNELNFCEGEWSAPTSAMRCPTGKQVQVQSAQYGRFDTSQCVHKSLNANRLCAGLNVKDKLQEICAGKQDCALTKAPHLYFSDPCVGTYKQMSVKYKCV